MLGRLPGSSVVIRWVKSRCTELVRKMNQMAPTGIHRRHNEFLTHDGSNND